MKGYFVEDFVILGDELMELAKNNQTKHPLALDYIQTEKSKFIFGCTTRQKIITSYFFSKINLGKLFL